MSTGPACRHHCHFKKIKPTVQQAEVLLFSLMSFNLPQQSHSSPAAILAIDKARGGVGGWEEQPTVGQEVLEPCVILNSL